MIAEQNGFAVLLENIIEKYAGELDLDSLSDLVFQEDKTINHNTDKNVEMPKVT